MSKLPDPRQFDLFAPPTSRAPLPICDDAEAKARRVEEWQEFSTRIKAADDLRGRETLKWGKDSRAQFTVDLLQMDDGWHYRSDFDMPNMGGSGPFAREFFATRDAALIDCLRKQLADIARHLEASKSSVNHGSDAQWLDMARWCIEQAVPILFGGTDLRADFDRLRVMYRQREQLRCAAICAGAKGYIGEDGQERSIYSL